MIQIRKPFTYKIDKKFGDLFCTDIPFELQTIYLSQLNFEGFQISRVRCNEANKTV